MKLHYQASNETGHNRRVAESLLSRLIIYVGSSLLACRSVVLIFTAGLIFAGCSESADPPSSRTNTPPKVWVSSGPPVGSTTSYVVDMVWGGWDPDGVVAYYEYCITDNENGVFEPADTTGRNKWNKTARTRSEFKFTADEPADPDSDDWIAEFIRSHTFFVRAVDNRGMPSSRPAYRSFTARTLSPTVTITFPPATDVIPTFVPPITTLHWVAEDYVDDLDTVIEPDSVSWILEPTSHHNQSFDETADWIRSLAVDSPAWGDWVWYGAPDGSGRSWTPPPLNYEPYVFAIRAKDEAGAITPVFDFEYNLRRIQVSYIDTGPILTVRNEFIGAVITAICNEPVTIVDIPAGVPLEYCFEASADHYPGNVAAYRYGWDIEDLFDPELWETDYIPYPGGEVCLPRRTFYFGTHTLTIEVIDNSGFCSRVEFKINIIPFTMERDLLLVDDFTEASTIGWDDPVAPGLTPSDEQHDLFWDDVLSDLADHYVATEVRIGDRIPITELAKYKSIIWSAYFNKYSPGAVLHELIKYRPERPIGGGGGKRNVNSLALYLAAGGHILICGNHPVSACLNHEVTTNMFRFPLIFLYELGGDQTTIPDIHTDPIGEESFAYRDLCLETLDFAWTTNVRRRDESVRGNCPVSSRRVLPADHQRIHTMRGAIPIAMGFPQLDELREEAAGPGRAFHIDIKGWDAEVYNPDYFFDLCPTVSGSRDCFEPIYGLSCVDADEPTYGAPVAFWTSTYADRVADAPGSIPARSAVFGFPPVYFKPEQVRGAIEAIIFGEWQLPRK